MILSFIDPGFLLIAELRRQENDDLESFHQTTHCYLISCSCILCCNKQAVKLSHIVHITLETEYSLLG